MIVAIVSPSDRFDARLPKSARLTAVAKYAGNLSNPVDAVLVGAGNRGHLAYGAYALQHPENLRFVAVADPDEGRRRRFADAHAIPPERQFRSWEDLADRPQLA